MFELINKIFEENKFQIHSLETQQKSIFASDINRSSHYLAIFFDDEEKIDIDCLNNYYDVIKRLEEGYNPQMDKNLSMLVFLKMENFPSDNKINKIIFDIEEDPYFFKKYVIVYTAFQVETVLHHTKESSIMDYLYTVLNEVSSFQDHKNNPYVESQYNLVSKLFIKLPFLDLRKMNRELASLENTIKESLDFDLLQIRDYVLNLKKQSISSEIDFHELLRKYVEVDKDE